MDFLLRRSKRFFLLFLGYFLQCFRFLFCSVFQYKGQLIIITKHAIDRIVEKVFEKHEKCLDSLFLSYATTILKTVKTSSSSPPIPNYFPPMRPPQQTKPPSSSNTKNEQKYTLHMAFFGIFSLYMKRKSRSVLSQQKVSSSNKKKSFIEKVDVA